MITQRHIKAIRRHLAAIGDILAASEVYGLDGAGASPKGDTFGQRVASLRKGAGLTQRQLAERLGWHQSQLQRIEADESSPTLSTASAIAGALGAPLRDMVD